MASEKLLEKKLKSGVEAKNGMSVKVMLAGVNGLPDRFVFMPNGKFHLVELKTTGKGLRDSQKIMFPILEALGFKVWVIDTRELLAEFLNEISK